MKGAELFWRARVRVLAAVGRLKLILGAADTQQPGWIATDSDRLDLLHPEAWLRYFPRQSVRAFLAEHVWEHLTAEEARTAAETCRLFLRRGGHLRVAVPDGFHPDPEYIESVRVGGTGAGAQDHRMLYNYRSLKSLFEGVGFRVELLEYFDEQGQFHARPWESAAGHVKRSLHFDPRNHDGKLNYTSLMLDAIQP